MIVIRKSAPLSLAIRWREIWQARDLLYFLAWRDVKVRYKQALLGVLWAALQPALSTIVLALVLGRVTRVAEGTAHYPLFVCAGFVVWAFFSNALTASSNSLVGSSHLMTKVYFPRILVPTASVVAGTIDLAVALVVLFCFMAWYGVLPPASPLAWAGMLLLLLLTVLLALGVGLSLSALNVLYRDLRHALPFLTQIWMFATPVVYPLDAASPRLRPLLLLNPAAGIVEGFRALAFGRPVPWDAVAVSVAATVLLFVVGAIVFRMVERVLADVV